jgi:hypothetical protein
MNAISLPCDCNVCGEWDCVCVVRISQRMKQAKTKQEQYDKYMYMMHHMVPLECTLLKTINESVPYSFLSLVQSS